MKKLMAMLLASAMLLSVALTGCGDDKDSGDGKDGKYNSVAFVCGNIGDKSFNDVSWKGVQEGAEENNIKSKVIEYGADTKSKMEPTLNDAADTYDIVVASGGEMAEILEKFWEDYPNKRFILFDIDPDYDNKMSNAFCINFKQNEGDFLAGALAQKMSKTGTIGFVGGGEVVVIQDFLVGYIQGSKYANESGKVAIAFIGNWTDSAKAKELSGVQINTSNADVLHQVAGSAGLGLFQACQENGKKWAIGVDADQRNYFLETDPDLADVILTSMEKKCDVAIRDAINKTFKGEAEYGTLVKWGVAEGVTVLSENDFYKENVPADVQSYIDDVEAKITAGEIKIDTMYGMATDVYNALRDGVKA